MTKYLYLLSNDCQCYVGYTSQKTEMLPDCVTPPDKAELIKAGCKPLWIGSLDEKDLSGIKSKVKREVEYISNAETADAAKVLQFAKHVFEMWCVLKDIDHETESI